MYEIKSERVAELEHVYLVFRDVPEGNPFEDEMIMHNVIPGVLPMQTIRIGESKFRRYCVDGCISLKDSLIGQKLSGLELRRILGSLFSEIADSKNYLLREESFVIKPDCIFLRVDTGEVELVYCPEYEKVLPEQMKALSDWLLGYLDSQDAQAVYSGYAFHVLSHEEGSTMQRMLTAVSRESQGRIAASDETDRNPVMSYRLPGEDSEYPMSSVAEGSVYADERPQKKKGIRGLLSFFSGMSVLFVLACALLWAMG